MLFVSVVTFLMIFTLFQNVNTQNPVQIVEQTHFAPIFNNDGSQKYGFMFKSSDDIEREENGYFNPDKNVGLVVKGSYSYNRPDGKKEIVNYIADKNGFRIVPETAVGFNVGLRIAPGALASLAG